MPTLASDLIESTRHHLLTGQPEKLNKLGGSLTSNATSFTLTYDISGLQAGTIIAIDLEEIFVFQVDAVSKSVTDCIRGYNGSTAAAHNSGAIVTVQPKFSNFRVLEAINDDLKDLSSPLNGLYQLKSVDLTFNPVTFGYDMTSVTDVIGVQEVRFRTPGPQKTWPKIDSWQLLRNATATGDFGDFPSGFGLVVYESAQPGYPIHVIYRAPYVPLVNLTDNVLNVTGLVSTMLDLPPIGAAIRLVAGREIKRNFDEAQGEPRRAEEVPPQANIQSVSGLRTLRRDRIMAESVRLQRAYSYEFVG
jgi:hypothetical protein